MFEPRRRSQQESAKRAKQGRRARVTQLDRADGRFSHASSSGAAATTLSERRKHAISVAHALAKAYPDAKCELVFGSPLELLVAVILSAQCTDKRVNLVTERLFRKYRTAEDYASAPLEQLERDILSTGFYRNKARHIRDCCRRLLADHGGQVPRRMKQLVALPGVGRKTANVVLGAAFGITSGIVVDTHVRRLARRLGLTNEQDPVKIERDLMALLPRSHWIKFSYRLATHGRTVCTARLTDLSRCFLARLRLCECGDSSPLSSVAERPSLS